MSGLSTTVDQGDNGIPGWAIAIIVISIIIIAVIITIIVVNTSKRRSHKIAHESAMKRNRNNF